MEILKRADVPQEFTWDLTPVFANDDAWFAEYEALKAYPGKISEYRGTLGKGAEDCAFTNVSGHAAKKGSRIA